MLQIDENRWGEKWILPCIWKSTQDLFRLRNLSVIEEKKSQWWAFKKKSTYSDCEIWAWLKKRKVNGGHLKKNRSSKRASYGLEGQLSLQSILCRFSKVCYIFAFNLITLKFSKHGNDWMLIPVTGLGCILLGYSGYSYSGSGITEYTEFQFRKERSYMFQIWKRNWRWPENYYICARAAA